MVEPSYVIRHRTHRSVQKSVDRKEKRQVFLLSMVEVGSIFFSVRKSRFEIRSTRALEQVILDSTTTGEMALVVFAKTQTIFFFLHLVNLSCRINICQDSIDIAESKRFRDETFCTGGFGLDSKFIEGMSSYKNNNCIRIAFRDKLASFHPTHHGHLYVQKDAVVLDCCRNIHGLFPIVHDCNIGDTVTMQHTGKNFLVDEIVLGV
mmetsp:Transcript_28295/g.59538  ORF Transcript_28295/g.59538 Transcript_28295/m.59538 type:complete len:206 (+) Transcript_28295:451-1068(+)